MSCLFCRIGRGEIPATIVLDEPELLAFRDINPVAPTHILIIPKRHIASLAEITAAESGIIGKMFLTARELAAREGVLGNGFRTVFNTGPDAGQTVFHLHLHLLAGRPMTWPPG
ncbi:MAG: histidine triad nucleotide-binding protein [Gammaproteobacteria bacterium]|nr:histidine triad nucleotide-binding protein [Gammaproteobacteria bacterium]